MEKITPAARREFSFPSPVDVHSERSDEQKDKKNDERPPALQNKQTVEQDACSRKLSECQPQILEAQAGGGFNARIRCYCARKENTDE